MNSLDREYQILLEYILGNGVDKADRTGTGTKSIFSWQIRHNMNDGFPLLTTKKMAFKTMVTELLWFLRGDTNIKFLVDNGCHIWDGDAWENYKRKTLEEFMDDTTIAGYAITNKEQFINKIKTDDKFAKQWGELGPIYGAQWRKWVYDKDMDYGTESSVDQIQNLINELKTNPDSRRLMVSAWNVGELDQMVLPPCHYGFQMYTREMDETERVKLMDKCLGLTEKDNLPTYYTVADLKDKNIPTRAISLMWNQRSVDTFLGLPFNIASYGLLLEIIAKTVNMVPDQLIGNLGDVHLYNNHIEQAKEQISRSSFELPKLKMNPIFLANLEHKGLDEAVNGQVNFELDNYQYHPSIKAPLSN